MKSIWSRGTTSLFWLSIKQTAVWKHNDCPKFCIAVKLQSYYERGPLKLLQLNKDQLTDIAPQPTVDVFHSGRAAPANSPRNIFQPNPAPSFEAAELVFFGPEVNISMQSKKVGVEKAVRAEKDQLRVWQKCRWKFFIQVSLELSPLPDRADWRVPEERLEGVKVSEGHHREWRGCEKSKCHPPALERGAWTQMW